MSSPVAAEGRTRKFCSGTPTRITKELQFPSFPFQSCEGEKTIGNGLCIICCDLIVVQAESRSSVAVFMHSARSQDEPGKGRLLLNRRCSKSHSPRSLPFSKDLSIWNAGQEYTNLQAISAFHSSPICVTCHGQNH